MSKHQSTPRNGIGHVAGRSAYGDPVVTGPSSLVAVQPGKLRRPRPLKKLPSNGIAIDNTYTDNGSRARMRADFIRSQEVKLMQTKSISVAIINRTKDYIDLESINSGITGLPALHYRYGSLGIRYKYRLVDNWTKIDTDPETMKNKAKEWNTNTNIGLTEIIIELSDEYVATVRATGTPSPKPAIKVDVFIPPYLLDLVARGMFLFVDDKDEMAMLRSYGIHANHELTADPTQALMEKADSLYNKNRDKVTYARKANELTGFTKRLNITPETAGWRTAQAARMLRPQLRIDPGKLAKQYTWVARNLAQFSDDYQLVNLGKTTALARGLGEVSKPGAVLGIGIISYKVGTDSWTGGSIYADGVLAAAPIVAAIVGGTMAVTVVFWATLAYGLYEIFTEGQLADLWDHLSPRDKRFALPVFTTYQNRH